MEIFIFAGLAAGALLQLPIYVFGGRHSLGWTLLLSILVPTGIAAHDIVACADGNSCGNSPGDAFAPFVGVMLLFGWLMPTLGIVMHWASHRPKGDDWFRNTEW